MIHDAFQPLSYWNNFMPSPNWQGVLIDTHIYQMFSVAVSCLLITTDSSRSSSVYTFTGQPKDQCSAHLSRMRAGKLAHRLSPLACGGRVDPRCDRLREIPERPRRRRALRRLLPRLHARRQLHGPHRQRVVFQRELQDVPAAVLGGAGDVVREGRAGVDPVDVEGGERG
jgi:hypothetical protein